MQTKKSGLKPLVQYQEEFSKRAADGKKEEFGCDHVTQLHHWPKQLLEMNSSLLANPKSICNSAVFTVRSKTKPRSTVQSKNIFALGGLEIKFTGIELRALDDEIIWLVLVDLAKRHPLNEWVRFTPYQLCEEVGWDRCGFYYKKVHSCLLRLKSANIEISSKCGERGKVISLIEDFEWDRGVHRIRMSKNIFTIFSGSQFAYIGWEKYRKLSPIARRLYDYAASHKKPHELRVETTLQLCGSNAKSLIKWKQQVKKACDELEDRGLLRKAL